MKDNIEKAEEILDFYGAEILRLSNNISNKSYGNEIRRKFYESKAYQDTGLIKINPNHSKIKVKLGWASIIIEVQNEQMRLMGFKNAPKEISYIFEENYLSTESEKIHRDAMIYGTSYAMIAQGDIELDEPEVLITAESPLNCWGDMNPRSRMLDNFIKIIPDESGNMIGTYFDRDYKVDFTIIYGAVRIDDISENKLKIVPAVRFVNKPSGSNNKGHSEITASIQSMIYSAQESLTEAAISRRIYTNPHRYILNIDESSITDEDGEAIDTVEMYNESMLVITKADGDTNNSGDKIQAGQFAASSPKPFYETIPEYARQVQAETGFPEILIGIPNGNNPSSADALRIQYKRLLDKCESRARNFSNSWKLLMKIAMKISGKELSREEYFNLKASWKPFRISTPASDADAVSKLVSAGILDAKSALTAERVGISPDEYLEIIDERAKNPSTAIESLVKAAGVVTESSPAISMAVESMERTGNFEV